MFYFSNGPDHVWILRMPRSTVLIILFIFCIYSPNFADAYLVCAILSLLYAGICAIQG